MSARPVEIPSRERMSKILSDLGREMPYKASIGQLSRQDILDM